MLAVQKTTTVSRSLAACSSKKDHQQQTTVIREALIEMHLEVSNVLPDLLEVDLLVLSRDDVVGPLLLVGSDEVGVVDTGKRLDVLHQGSDLSLEVVGEDLGSGHRGRQVVGRDVPTRDDEVVGVDHGEHVGCREEDLSVIGGSVGSTQKRGRTERDVNVLAGVVGSKSDRRRSDELQGAKDKDQYPSSS